MVWYGDYDQDYFDHMMDDSDVSEKNKNTNVKSWYKVKRELPEVSRKPDGSYDLSNFIRAKDGCYELVSSAAWGRCLIPVKDPEATTELDSFDKKGIKLIDNFPQMPKELWARIIALYFEFCVEKKNSYGYRSTDDNEVSVVFLRRLPDLQEWKVIVPKQTVSGGAVDADFSESVDIVTGEKYTSFPPITKDEQGNDVHWAHSGSSHSHNTMGAFFSSTDDKSELGVPGMHIVVGQIDTVKREYVPKASIVLRENRKEVDITDVVDVTPLAARFHKNCLDLIEKKQVVRWSSSSHSTSYSSKTEPKEKMRADGKWVLGALWDPDTQRWVYVDDSGEDGFDMIECTDGRELVGRVNKISMKGINLKPKGSNSYSNEILIPWEEIASTGVAEEEEEDVEIILLPGDVDDDDDDEDFARYLKDRYGYGDDDFDFDDFDFDDLPDDARRQMMNQLFGESDRATAKTDRLPPMV